MVRIGILFGCVRGTSHNYHYYPDINHKTSLLSKTFIWVKIKIYDFYLNLIKLKKKNRFSNLKKKKNYRANFERVKTFQKKEKNRQSYPFSFSWTVHVCFILFIRPVRWGDQTMVFPLSKSATKFKGAPRLEQLAISKKDFRKDHPEMCGRWERYRVYNKLIECVRD